MTLRKGLTGDSNESNEDKTGRSREAGDRAASETRLRSAADVLRRVRRTSEEVAQQSPRLARVRDQFAAIDQY